MMGTSRDQNRVHRDLRGNIFVVLLLLALLQTGTEAQTCPSDRIIVRIDENNAAGAVITTLPVADGVNMEITTPNTPFVLEGKNVVATEVLDFEKEKSYPLNIRCIAGGSFELLILINNLNDNRPTFAKELYTLSIPEMTAVDTPLETFVAHDNDNLALYYTLTPSDFFRLKSRTEPQLIVAKLLQFDDNPNVQLTLTVQDADPAIPLHTTSTTINITIEDVDNRTPWFLPCDEVEVQGVTICPNLGYTGRVSLGELQTGPLPLYPKQISAIDGDKGINAPIKYTILSGSKGLFVIGEDTGAITMTKAPDKEETYNITVMASQATNSYQFVTTSLTMEVIPKSNHNPQFEKTHYEAIVEGVGSMAVEAPDKSKVLKIVATDQDYPDGINPNIVYSILGYTEFSVIGSYLFMTTKVAAGSYNMAIVALDTENSQNATAQLAVEVVEEPTTTAPPTTVTSPTTEQTTGETAVTTPKTTAKTTDQTPDTTINPSPDTTINPSTIESPTPSTNPSTPSSTGPSVQTPGPTTSGDGTTGVTAHTVILPVGGFTSADMAALGATLGALLFLSIVAVTVLAVKLQKGNSNWKKINEASAFRSSLGPSRHKEGVQFTNEAFHHDDDDNDKRGPSGGGLRSGPVSETDQPQTRSLPRPPSPIAEDEKEVKPILAKDKSKEDGYRAVWFKEDIDPDAKEVVIIDSREEEEEEEESDEENKIPKVKFHSDTDVDSGLGDKMEESEETASL